MGTDIPTRCRSSALYLLKLKEHRRITQTAIDDVVEGSQCIFQQTIQTVHAGVRACLANNGIDPDDIHGLNDVFLELSDPFLGLENNYKQEKYYKENLGLVVRFMQGVHTGCLIFTYFQEPKEVRIGEVYLARQFSGSKARVIERQDTFQYIPFFKTLKQLLQDESILEQIEQCLNRMRSDGFIEDICDGSIFHTHPLFSTQPNALQILAYYDEVEMCNPLGSHIKKHKLGVVFYTLGNIHPKFRSSLRAINLALVATVPIIEKYGINQFLQPFLSDLEVLQTSCVKVSIRGVEHTFKGALLAFLADNLASNTLGGFKLSFSFSFRSCRSCLVPNTKLSDSFFSEGFIPRSKENHEEQCKLLQGPLSEHYSKTYGINFRSCLLDISYFSMFGGGLPHDAMHDLLEGIAPMEIKLLILVQIS